ncbi:MAG: sulfurtransferase [Bdellovibrio sp.]|nr:sulfurtransferase [Bdellovibrio sp.]
MKISDNSLQLLRIMNIAFYRFQKVELLDSARQFFKSLCLENGLKGTVLLSHEGINGSLAGEEASVRRFQEVLAGDPQWSGLEFKESFSSSIPFRGMYVKLKKEIIPVGDATVTPEQHTGPRISAETLKKWLDEKREFLFLDTRNDYEVAHGTFEGAKTLELKHFRNFRECLKALAPEARNQPMVMFCTGGIRCEKASVLAEKEGFQEVYQLDGGILKYFEKFKGEHYRGNCFVFDHRVALDPELKPVAAEYLIPQAESQE